jgi:hypothetical protein
VLNLVRASERQIARALINLISRSGKLIGGVNNHQEGKIKIAAVWSAQLLWLPEKCQIILPILVSGCFLNLTIRRQLECHEIDRSNNQYRNIKRHHLDGRICLSEPTPLLKLLQNQLMD